VKEGVEQGKRIKGGEEKADADASLQYSSYCYACWRYGFAARIRHEL
jgi:hypothetical protein